MKLTLQLRLLPTVEQADALRATMERFNAAASFAANVGFEAGAFSQPSIHKLCYRELRDRFGLSAQMAVRAIGKAVEAFRTLHAQGRRVRPTFKALGAVTYDERILGFKGPDKVSLWVLGGRTILAMVYGAYQGERFDRIKGQCDLVHRDGAFYLYATVDLPEPPPVPVEDFLGVDLGIVQLATDSDGNAYTGADVEKVRRRHHRNRQRLQRKGTKGAKKRLRKLSGREARFRRHENHRISKAVVALAKDTGRGLALEDLTHIRSRTTVRRRDRARHSGWAFRQLRAFLTYKAALAGVPAVAVDPRDTSRTCNACGHCERANRKSQARFECRQCGYSANADLNAALNLRVRGLGCRKPPPELAGLSA